MAPEFEWLEGHCCYGLVDLWNLCVCVCKKGVQWVQHDGIVTVLYGILLGGLMYALWEAINQVIQIAYAERIAGRLQQSVKLGHLADEYNNWVLTDVPRCRHGD